MTIPHRLSQEVPLTGPRVPGKHYVTVRDAVDLLGVAERTIRRWRASGRLHVVRDHQGNLLIDAEDIERERSKLQASPQPLGKQLQTLHTDEQALAAQVQAQAAQIQALTQQMANLQQQVVTVYHLVQVQQDDHREPIPLSVVLGNLPRQHQQRQHSAAERRGLPAGTQRLVPFARQHSIAVGEIKRWYAEGRLAVTLHQRSVAERNKQEWWLLPEQQAQVIAHLQQQQIAYTTCPLCPHTTGEQLGEQATQ